tara:strand:+ start:7070 stop:9427 length:2358 start_codon:yes stop_codon:yes gene_type:complete
VSDPTPKQDDTEEASSQQMTALDADVEAELDNLVGEVLGNYRLIDKIGEGASAVVYRAEHVQLGVHYAVKILHPAILSRKGMKERFLREARAAGQLRHENVVFIADFAVDSKLGPYMVMEYLEGETLQAILEREGALPLERIHNITRQAIQAIGVAHEAGIIHRDLKPENILLTPRKNREVVKILDFGIARLAQGDASLTGAGHIIGTPLYMSPEQCRGNKELTKASDIYSFGVMLYQMLTGQPPFTGDNPQKLIIDHFLVPPPELGPEFPEPLRVLQADLLAKNPIDRPDTMEEVWERLNVALTDEYDGANDTRDQLPAIDHTHAIPTLPNPHEGNHAGHIQAPATKQTNTWRDEFQADPWSNQAQESPAKLSIGQQPTSSQTLGFGDDAPKHGIRLVNDPMRQTLETSAISPSSIIVQQNKKRSAEHGQDPLIQDFEQLFSNQSSSDDLPNNGYTSQVPPDPDAELLKDLDRLSQPSSAPAHSWSTEHNQTPSGYNSPQTPQSTGSFAPPQPAHQMSSTPHTPNPTGSFSPPPSVNPMSVYASQMITPPETTYDIPGEENSHTEVEIAGINIASPDINMTNEDVGLARRLREIDQTHQDSFSNASGLSFDDNDPLQQYTNTRIDPGKYGQRRKNSNSPAILLFVVLAVFAVGVAFFMLRFFAPNVLPESLRPAQSNTPIPSIRRPVIPNPTHQTKAYNISKHKRYCIEINSLPKQAQYVIKIKQPHSFTPRGAQKFGNTDRTVCFPKKLDLIIRVQHKGYISKTEEIELDSEKQTKFFDLKKQ